MYTLIYLFSYYVIEVQHWHANDIDIINYQEKKIVWVAGLRKGRGKVFGRTRARACEEKIRMVPFPSPSLLRPFKSISFSFQKPAMQPKEKIANVWNHYETVNMLSSNTYATLTSLGDEGDTVKWRKYKSFHFIVYFIVFLLSCIFLIFTFLTLKYLVDRFVRWRELRGNQTKREKIWAMKHATFLLKLFNIPLMNVLGCFYWKKGSK